jgi:hypothetical protein
VVHVVGIIRAVIRGRNVKLVVAIVQPTSQGSHFSVGTTLGHLKERHCGTLPGTMVLDVCLVRV